MSNFELVLPKTAFGEIEVSNNTPVVQLMAQYGNTRGTQSVLVGGGSTGATGGKFFCETPAAANTVSAIISRRAVIYRAGQGAKARFTARFDTPAAGSEQDAGLLGFNDTLSFGYDGTEFGIWYRHGAEQEVQLLTITSGAAGAETATVTVDGTGYSVPLTAGSVGLAAAEIAESLNSQVPLWDFDYQWDGVSATAELVAIQNLVAVPTGGFAFSSATAAGTWSQVQGATVWTKEHIPQAEWSEVYDFEVNPGKLTPYEVSYEYLGAGGIEFKVENPRTGNFEIVHILQPAGKSDDPTLRNPSFRIGVASENMANATAIRTETASMAGFLEGMRSFVDASRAASATATIGTTLTNLITLRNKFEFGNIRNLGEIVPIGGTLQVDSTKSVQLLIIENANPVAGEAFNFVDHDNGQSAAQVAKNAVEIDSSSGNLIEGGGVGGFNLLRINEALEPGNSITIAARMVSGAASEMTATLTWFDEA